MNPTGWEEFRCRHASTDVVAIYASGNESQNQNGGTEMKKWHAYGTHGEWS